MDGCARCPCGQVLDPDERWPDCPACGGAMSSPSPRPDRAGLRIILAVAGFLAVVTVGWLTVSLSKRSLPPLIVPPPEVAAAVEPLPAPPPVVPAVEPRPVLPRVEPPPPAAVPRVEQPPVPTGRTGVIESAGVPPGGYRVGETIPQDLVVTRRSTFRILGTDVSQGAQYGLSSTVTVTAVNADGSFVVEQAIVAARLIDADPDLQADLATALGKARGVKFELTVGPTGLVTAIKGYKDALRLKPGKLGEFQSLRLGSLVDADGWKELAGLMFFQPDEVLKPGAKGSRAVTHDWGALGGWSGKTNYVAKGKASAKSPLDRIDYAHAITYQPPAAGVGTELPFRVTKAEFKAVAGGAILFDAARSRTTAAEEAFYVRGGLVASVAGPDVPIEMEERQNFKLTFTDPAAGTLVGKPPKK